MSLNYSNARRYLASHIASDEHLAKVNMRGSRAAGSKWTKCTFESCHFDVSLFTGALIDRCKFVNCNFQNTTFAGATVLESEFRGCDAVQADFSSVFIADSGFPECRLEFSSFLDANLKSVSFRSANLTGAILLYASQKDTDYSGATLYDAAFRLGCKFYRDAKFDANHWQLFQALVSYGKGYEALHAFTMDKVNPRIVKLVADLVEKGHEE